jgi:hypothetical protein
MQGMKVIGVSTSFFSPIIGIDSDSITSLPGPMEMAFPKCKNYWRTSQSVFGGHIMSMNVPLKKREWHLCLLLKSGRDLTPNP